jgi:hypothetical protein
MRGLTGVPDLVIKILSPEYRYIEVNIRDGDCYRTAICTESVSYKDFELELTKIFPAPPQEEE